MEYRVIGRGAVSERLALLDSDLPVMPRAKTELLTKCPPEMRRVSEAPAVGNIGDGGAAPRLVDEFARRFFESPARDIAGDGFIFLREEQPQVARRDAQRHGYAPRGQVGIS